VTVSRREITVSLTSLDTPNNRVVMVLFPFMSKGARCKWYLVYLSKKRAPQCLAFGLQVPLQTPRETTALLFLFPKRLRAKWSKMKKNHNEEEVMM